MNANLQHYAIVEELSGEFTVRWRGQPIARAGSVLCLTEFEHGRQQPPVYYFRPADVDASLMEPSATSSYCPIKGHAAYRDLVQGHHRQRDAVWMYLQPLPMAEGIRGCYAFAAGDDLEVEVAARSA